MEEEIYQQLAFYTLSLGDAAFIHQHVVDAWAAQNARPDSKPISVAFALIGLYLLVEKRYTGREVQKAHLWLARRCKDWPRFTPPRGPILYTACDVMQFAPGVERDKAIYKWCAAVWQAWSENHKAVAALADIAAAITPKT